MAVSLWQICGYKMRTLILNQAFAELNLSEPMQIDHQGGFWTEHIRPIDAGFAS